MGISLTTTLLLFFAIIGNAAANILIKSGANKIGAMDNLGHFALKAITSPAIIAGCLLFAVVLAAYSAVLTKVPLSIAYPLMTSLGFLIVVSASVTLFRETIYPGQIFGMVLILIGLWLVARQLAA